MFCTNCGNYNPDGVERCATCGQVLGQTYQDPFYASQMPVDQPKLDVSTGKGLGIASMILAICSLCLSCCCYTSFIAAPMSILSVIFGIISLSKAKKAGVKSPCAVVGLIITGVCVVIALVFVLLYVFTGSLGILSEMMSSY